ncbi:YbjQ family protein [Aeoliella mucimassa]|uniref:YbjQ family protein n=1 Tax=Aeoliella mucimassa TaxID=2527972 RepID=A0A518AM47_9BACT|nr:heavy metal-binding domain-containing protein [Aeoliella mucimassa]QDU55797.1 hypothetical protein Pan181_19930 [Aeoliella mucimassa]
MDTQDLIALVLTVGGFVFMIGLGFFAGGWIERSHLQSLEERELQNHDFFVTQVKSHPGITGAGPVPKAFFAEAVISSDYLKTFLGSLRNFFGGEVMSFRTLMDRARREALQRIIAQARAEGYNAICNVRLETADIGGNTVPTGKQKPFVMCAILASATAYHRA